MIGAFPSIEVDQIEWQGFAYSSNIHFYTKEIDIFSLFYLILKCSKNMDSF